MNKTPIEWTDYTWNPVRARLKGASHKARSGTFCTRISPGCTNCYASTINRRFGTGMTYTVPNLAEHEFFIDERILTEPLKLRKPSRIFVGDMFDLFHGAISDADISYVFATMTDERARKHTFQLLTKRADNMRRFIQKWGGGGGFEPNIWLGVSVEDQQRANERIPLLLQTPAAVRFLSVEPLLEAVNLVSIDGGGGYFFNCLADRVPFGHYEYKTGINWVIVGGESGPGARPFNLAWAESLLAQCEAAQVPFFMKQLGSKPERDGVRYIGNFDGYQTHEVTGKGGEMHQWPPSLRVREFPASQKAEAVPA